MYISIQSSVLAFSYICVIVFCSNLFSSSATPHVPFSPLSDPFLPPLLLPSQLYFLCLEWRNLNVYKWEEQLKTNVWKKRQLLVGKGGEPLCGGRFLACWWQNSHQNWKKISSLSSPKGAHQVWQQQSPVHCLGKVSYLKGIFPACVPTTQTTAVLW